MRFLDQAVSFFMRTPMQRKYATGSGASAARRAGKVFPARFWVKIIIDEEAFKENFFSEAVEKVDCELEGKVYESINVGTIKEKMVIDEKNVSSKKFIEYVYKTYC